VAAVINSNHLLEQLWLDGNEFCSEGVKIIASALKDHCKLRLLSLSNNGITDDAAEEISASITSNSLLEDLLLGSNHLQYRGVCMIAKALRKTKKLRKLDLSNNSITEQAAKELAMTLSGCGSIEELYLGNSRLAAGTREVLRALLHVSSLLVLAISDNGVTRIVDEICDIVRNNKALDILLIGGNDLKIAGAWKIVEVLCNSNTAIRLLAIGDSNISAHNKEEIKAVLTAIPNLQFFL